MKAKRIIYSRLISKGNFENAKIEIELEVEEGETAQDVFAKAKEFVQNRIDVERLSDYKVQESRKILSDRRNHTLNQIEEAEKIISIFECNDDLPF